MRVGYAAGGARRGAGAGRPARPLRPVVRRGRVAAGARRAQRDGRGDGRRRRVAGGADRAPQGVRRRRVCGSSPTRGRPRRPAGCEPARGAGLPVAPAAPPGAGDRRRSSGCPTTWSRPTSRPGRATRSSARGPARSPPSSRTGPSSTRRLAEVAARFPADGAGAGAAALGRLPGGAGRLGVLGRPRGAPARPAALRTAGRDRPGPGPGTASPPDRGTSAGTATTPGPHARRGRVLRRPGGRVTAWDSPVPTRSR